MGEVEPRLYLITPPVTDGPGFLPVLRAALGVCDVACLLLRTAPMDDGTRRETLRLLAAEAQGHGVACLVENDPTLARDADMDGVHMEATGAALAAALEALHPAHIVGAGSLTTRDAAMTAGESGVDYLMFGGPADADPHQAVVERVAWWAEIFNVPCVGYAHDVAGIADLVRAGADFVALCGAVFDDPRGVTAALHEAATTLSRIRMAA